MKQAHPDTSDLISRVLLEQQTLRTPVALFSEEYDSKSVRERFTHLIPLSKPSPGAQYGFEVNLDACTGCKACVAACHSLNGLDDNESWRDMGLLVGTRIQPYQQTVTTACHHCADPACADGCPVLAYDKDPITGIVRHLDDQCIGCSYCILKCPYDVPKFNIKRGIVRKCDMCQGRLAEDEAPACVQACPNEAIKIKAVKLDAVPDRGQIIAGAFESSYTRPTTTYLSAKPIPTHAKAADAGALRLDHAHVPLTVMLVLTQMSAGGFFINAIAAWLGSVSLHEAGIVSLVAFIIGLAGIALSVLHLGQPLKAWRAFLGWRKSWLSREIIAFGLFAKLGALTMAAWWLGDFIMLRWAITLAAAGGVLAVFTSVMVYVDTRRPFWSLKLTCGKFFGTMLLLGTAMPGVSWAWMNVPAAKIAIPAALILRWLVSLFEIREIKKAQSDESSPWHLSARILTEKLPHLLRARRIMLLIVGIVLPTIIVTQYHVALIFTLSVAITLTSQLIERYYFFTAAAGCKMPGN
ncbi:MAG: DmsC/YnfH family molybdoenzyme membrane anchor subunit [Prosthecobacter sp.]